MYPSSLYRYESLQLQVGVEFPRATTIYEMTVENKKENIMTLLTLCVGGATP